MSPYRKAFRATSGLDAANQNLINVASPRDGELLDGVNQEYFIRKNTIQEYDETREHYEVGFIVELNRRIYKCRSEINAAESFDDQKWEAMRIDPVWKETDSSTSASVGDHLFVIASTQIDITLPSDPKQGDTVTIKDGKGILSEYPVNVLSSNDIDIVREALDGNNETLDTVILNIPYSTVYFIYTGAQWTYQLHYDKLTSHISGDHSSQQGVQYKDSGFLLAIEQEVVYSAAAKPIAFTLPRNAQPGDTVRLFDSLYLSHQTFTILNVHPDDVANNNVNVVHPHTLERSSQMLLDSVGQCYMYADIDPETGALSWFPVISNDPDLWVHLGNTSTSQLRPNSYYDVEVADGISDITLTLPKTPQDGDWICLSHLKTAHIPVHIHVHPDMGEGEPDENDSDKYKIYNDFETYRLHKYTHYQDFNVFYTEHDTILGNDYGYALTLIYSHEDRLWKYQHVQHRIDVTDSMFPKRPGIVTFATPTEALAHGINNAHSSDAGKPWANQNPLPDDVITVETLDSRRSSETQVGIARISDLSIDDTLRESRTLSGDVEDARTPDSAFRHDIIVSPRGVNARFATETRRGVVEIATQTETRDINNDVQVLTPKKLHNAQAEEGLTGVGKLVLSTNTIDNTSETVIDISDMRNARPNNGTTGTIFDHDNHVRFVTPHVLNQYRATENQPGMLWVTNPTEMRVNNSTVDDAIITPKKLASWYLDDTVRGIARVGTQAEVNAQSVSEVANKSGDRPNENWTSVVVTPETLHNRTATETRRGLGQVASQSDLNAGTDDDYHFVTPLKFSTWQAYDHFTSDGVAQGAGYGVSGISHAGNIWSGVDLSVALATQTQRGTLEVATQTEADVYQTWTGSSFTGTVASDTHIITPAKLDKRRSTTTKPGIARRATFTEVSSGSTSVGNNNNDPSFVSPGDLTSWQRTSTEARASETRFGVLENASVSETWVGNSTDGSTQSYTSYVRNSVAVSPYALNYALQNYLPLNAKADDSELLDGLDSSQFVRSDVDDTITGKLTFETNPTIQGTAPLISYSETDTSAFWTQVLSGNEFSVREDGTNTSSTRFNIKGSGATDFSAGYGSGVVNINSTGSATDSNIFNVIGSITEEQSSNNVDTTYGSYSSPATGSLREKYLGINNVSKASEKWATPRTVTFSGDLSGSFTLDGSGNVGGVNIQVVNNSHSHSGENITSGTVSNNRLNKSTLNQQGIVRVTNDVRTSDPSNADSDHVALSAGAGKALSERIDLFTPDGGVGDNVAYRDYIQVGETRMSTSDAGVLEFTFGHPLT